MIDLKLLRENQELYAKGFAKKRVNVDIPQVLELGEQYGALLREVEEQRAEKNAVSKQIPTLPPDQRQAKIDEMKALDGKLTEAESLLKKLYVQVTEITLPIPNLPHESVPEGVDDEDNEVVKTVGKIPKFDFKPKDHLELGSLLDVIDMETGAKTSGARFY